MTKASNELRDWDIEPETRVGGVDAIGHLLYDWREAADSRLTLARSRCSVQQTARKTGKSELFDTPEYVALLAALPRGLRSA